MILQGLSVTPAPQKSLGGGGDQQRSEKGIKNRWRLPPSVYIFLSVIIHIGFFRIEVIEGSHFKRASSANRSG